VLLYGVTVAGVEAAVFGWISLALGVIDLEHQLLLDALTYPSIALGIALSFFGGLATPVESIVGALVGAAIPAATIGLYKLWRGIEGMGWGDVKYLAAIGAVVGVQGCLWVLVLAAIVGAAVGGALILARRGSMQTALPFGTFLAAAVLIWLYVPRDWLSWLAA
jgi:leader peptidase (prepilin peptidase)/N-methyltransferase